jgi:hypothetical protein
VEPSFRAAERARDDFGEPEAIVLTLPRELKRQHRLAAAACPAAVVPAVSLLVTGAVA